MLTIVKCVWLLGFSSVAWAAVPATWLNPKLDEINDSKIYEAVVKSMEEWRLKKERKTHNFREKREDASQVCYPDLGCFDASGPFGYLDMLPAKPEEINTKFLMYPGRNRRRSGSPPAEVPFGNINEAFEWAKQGFNKSLPTKVLIHGFGSDCGYIWIYEMRSALLGVEEVNVICVDWQNGATLPNYVKATANTRLVGKQLAMLLRGLVENNGLSLRNTHLIGFSLGAHIAGFAGADLKNLSRITGLDPAGPLFESQDPRARLDQTDAAFVDVIHSNGENLILGGLGSSQPMGHVDFYPNGGRMQKGCSHLFVGAVSDIIWSSAVEGRSLCNHRRAYKFFIDSVSPRCHFPAFPCGSYEEFLAGNCFPCNDERKCGNMGYYADRSKGRGQLYLITRDEEPFCAHQYHVKIETSPSPIEIKSYGKIQITLIGDTFLNETFLMTRKEDEEMILGESISRILVPHPILSQPTRIQITYTAYSGWLSSGLTQWRMDKVTLMDSFGKTSSVCKKNLILESGVPVTLPLYPGECNVPKEAQDRSHNTIEKNSNQTGDSSNFIATPVVRAGIEGIDKSEKLSPLSLRDAMDIFNIPFKQDKENKLLEEVESSRAFNARPLPKQPHKNREIVEPILKPHSSKHARSQNLDKVTKPEITEPILGPTTTKSTKLLNELIIEEPSSEEWVPNPSKQTKIFGVPIPEDPLESIATTVQFLPQRLAKMFEQAERYARETILPLVSTYTPKFISDIIAPKEKPKYVPLSFEESDSLRELARTKQSLNETNLKVEPPKLEEPVTSTTPYTHIQKIKPKSTTERKARDDSSKDIFIDLPVFSNDKSIKYIPLKSP